MLVKIHQFKSLYLHRLGFEWRRIRKIKRHVLLGKAITKLLGLISGIFLLPVTTLLHFWGFRHVTIFTDRIGHLALEPDCLLKEQSLGHIPQRKWIMLAPPGRVANKHLLTYWRPHFHVVQNRVACFLIENMSRWGLMRYDIAPYCRGFSRAQESFRIYANWGDRPPLLKLSPEDRCWGGAMMSKIGLPTESWFVCVHAREGGFSPVDEELQSHRNTCIDNTVPAIKEITRQGGWVIRIGDATMKPIPDIARVIDYAHHPLKSPRLDLILCATARFILGSTSGICLVGTIFGVPCAIANMVPTADLWYGPKDISIPKRIWDQRESRFLTIRESFTYPHGCFRYAKQYIDSKLQLIENSPEELEDLVKETIGRLEGRFIPTSEDISTIEGYRKIMDERYTSFYSIASISVAFCRKYKES